MEEPRSRTAEEIARLGREIYERDIRPEVERNPERRDGAFVVVDVTTGDWSLAENDDDAFDRAESKNPEGLFYLMRVGRPAAHRIGRLAGPKGDPPANSAW